MCDYTQAAYESMERELELERQVMDREREIERVTAERDRLRRQEREHDRFMARSARQARLAAAMAHARAPFPMFPFFAPPGP